MAILTRDAILQAHDIVREIVSVPEWGGEVIVQALNGAQRDEYEGFVLTIRGTDAQVNLRNARAKLVSMALIDDAGMPLFTESDIDALGAKSARALDRVYGVAQRLAGLTPGDVEELTKN